VPRRIWAGRECDPCVMSQESLALVPAVRVGFGILRGVENTQLVENTICASWTICPTDGLGRQNRVQSAHQPNSCFSTSQSVWRRHARATSLITRISISAKVSGVRRRRDIRSPFYLLRQGSGNSLSRILRVGLVNLQGMLQTVGRRDLSIYHMDFVSQGKMGSA